MGLMVQFSISLVLKIWACATFFVLQGSAGSVPPSSQQSMVPDNKGPLSMPIAPVQIAPPPKEILQTPPAVPPIVPEVPPSNLAVPPASPPRNLPIFSPPIHPTASEFAPSKLPGSSFNPVLSPPKLAPSPVTTRGLAPLLSPSTPTSFLPNNSAAPPINSQGVVPSLPPSASQINPPLDNPVMVPEAPVAVPVVPSFRKSPQISPAIHPVMPGSVPPSSQQSMVPSVPVVPGQIAPPPKGILQTPPTIQPIVTEVPPNSLAVPPASPPWSLRIFSPPIHPTAPEVAPSKLPVVLPPPKSVPGPETTKGLAPLLLPSTPTSFPPNNSAAPPINFRGIVPSLPPSASQINPQPDNPVMVPEAPVPIVPSFRKSPQISPAIHPVMSSSVPPSSRQSLAPDNKGPLSMPISPVQIAPPPKEILQNPPAIQPIVPEVPPSILAVPPASPPWNVPIFSPPIHPTTPEVAPSTLPGSSFNPPVVLPPPKLVPPPETTKGLAPLLSPSTPTLLPPNNSAAPPMNFQGIVPVLPPRASQKPPHMEDPVSVPEAPVAVPVIPPSRKSPQNSLPIHPVMPPSSQQGKAPDNKGPTSTPIAPVQIAPPPREILEKPPISQPTMPEVPLPSNLPVPAASTPRNLPKYSPPVHPTVPEVSPSNLLVPSASPPSILPRYSPPVHPIVPTVPPSNLPEPDVSPVSTPPLSFNRKRVEKPVAAPSNGVPKRSSPLDHSPAETPMHNNPRDPDNAPTPLSLIRPPPQEGLHAPTPLRSTSFYRHHHARKNITSPAPSSYLDPPTSTDKGPFSPPSHPPELDPKSKQKQHDPLVLNPVSPPHSPVSSSERPLSPASPRQALPPRQTLKPFLSPKISPSGSSSPRNPKIPHLPPVQSLPPPPPNQECTPLSCPEQLTNTPPGSRCGCVLPIQVGLRLSVALYTFFPLVSELATEIAGGVFMKQSQVRIMGANAASQDPQKTIVLTDLVPLEEKFDNTTAFLTYQRFWHKQVFISPSFFGDYEVLYVRYPGLPASPPSASSIIDGEAYGSHDNNGRTIKPLGVDIRRRQHKEGLKGSVLAIIILSASVAVILCCTVAWVLFFRHRDRNSQPEQSSPAKLPSLAKSSGIVASMIGSGPSSVSLSYNSSIAPYTGTAKTFSSTEIQRATDNFDPSRILGEGGFGLVFSGVLEDGTKVAVKVLKRDDQQGGREFLAEVEMLSRLHHRNLVKLIGICTEEHARCLVYELIPNGSVESHLHGVDMEDAPLDWGARLKIALGAARGLAYLHEDSSPRVIHRDFKSSNILLEHDFTPKVSDFGLARTALDEENRHISTRVMGTFGYVAPEYAMTGHLLVKSDVYSYGVVLLELLTGRKPVDMSQPPGQENVVNWARPLLTSQEGLELITDQSLGPDFPFDSISKVAAIASMCVQPEVSHRPFMGEVVQALKLVCNECEANKDLGSRSCSQEDISVDFDSRFNTNNSDHFQDPLQMDSSLSNYEPALDVERGLPVLELFGSARIGRTDFGSFRRHSSSGPLRRGRVPPLWQRMRRLSAGSLSDHGGILRLWPGSH